MVDLTSCPQSCFLPCPPSGRCLSGIPFVSFYPSMFSLWLFLPIWFSLLSGLNAAHLSSPRTVSELKYSRAHSLDDGYQFDARQGWESVNVTNLQYKYPRSITDLASTAGGNGALSSLKQLATDKSKIGKRKPSSSSITKSTLHFLNDVWNGLKGIGSLDTVKITWYVWRI